MAERKPILPRSLAANPAFSPAVTVRELPWVLAGCGRKGLRRVGVGSKSPLRVEERRKCSVSG